MVGEQKSFSGSNRRAIKTAGQPVCRHYYLYRTRGRTGHEPCASTYHYVVLGKCNSLTCEKLPLGEGIVGSSPRQARRGKGAERHTVGVVAIAPPQRRRRRSTPTPATPVFPAAPQRAVNCGASGCPAAGPAGQRDREKGQQCIAWGSARNFRANGQKGRACCDVHRLGRLPGCSLWNSYLLVECCRGFRAAHVSSEAYRAGIRHTAGMLTRV